MLVKLHNGLKCEQHPPSFFCTVPNDSPIPPSAAISTADPSKTLSSNSNEETDLKIPQIENANKTFSIRFESSQASSSFLLSSGEAVSSRIDRVDGFVENANHCKELDGLELVIYGIGNYAECLIARYQLALMLALRNALKLPQARLLVFDPRLSNIEKSVINELGLSLISHNEEGKRLGSVEHWTLFFMPHCGKALCNNLLWANWSPHQLANIIIIGNSFSSIVERSPERLLKKYYYYIWKIHSITDETSLPNSFKHADVFNDTSIHCFRSVDLSRLPKDFWLEHTEPVYDSSDLEIIVNK